MSKLKTLIKTSLTPIALCLTLVIASPVMAKKEGQRKHDGMRQVLSKLSLTDTQKQDVKQIFKESREDKGLYKADARSLRLELGSLVHSAEWDQTAVENAVLKRRALMQEKALQRAVNKHQIWNLLTEAQQTELVTNLAARKAKFEEMATDGKRKGKGKGKKFKKLNFSDEQLAAVKTIKTATKENAKGIKSNLKSFKQAEQTLIRSTDFNTEAWQSLNAEYQDDFIAMAVLKAKSKHDIWNLMTVEQQTAATEKSAKGMKGKKHKNKKSA